MPATSALKGKSRLHIKQTTHDVSQIPQTSKTMSQYHKETQHDVTLEGTFIYCMGQAKCWKTGKCKSAGILNTRII